MENKTEQPTENIYGFKANIISGTDDPVPFDFSLLKGKVVLIINVASNCGFTKQYPAIEALYKKYKDQGFEILAFPCNQFLFQEPGTNKEIVTTCTNDYGITFKMFEKTHVNGSAAHPLYKYLTSALLRKGMLWGQSGVIEWNFTKFLIDKNGVPVKRYAPKILPRDIGKDVEELLAAEASIKL